MRDWVKSSGIRPRCLDIHSLPTALERLLSDEVGKKRRRAFIENGNWWDEELSRVGFGSTTDRNRLWGIGPLRSNQHFSLVLPLRKAPFYKECLFGMSGVVFSYATDKLNRDFDFNCIAMHQDSSKTNIGFRWVLVQVMREVVKIFAAALSIILGLLKLAM